MLLAIGGSSNALIHLTAIAGRLGIPIDPHQLNQISDDTPTLVALKPTGSHYMEDFHASGGVPALLHRLRDSLELDAMTVTGQTLGQLLDAPHPGRTLGSCTRSTIRSRRPAACCGSAVLSPHEAR
ncbi:dihydroxy-acid dehydratase domain-containing protein [Pseudonocardia sp. Cha107L01]|uniref:dihydroxy-acid dehydratase domain-containing protein n=1 Tax=Pseudonocardia sp. Cha107L01 TaxID=3457576 RepID=UPI00403E4BD1